MSPNTGAVIAERERAESAKSSPRTSSSANFVPSELIQVDDRLYDAAKLSAWHPGGEVR